MLLEKKKKGLRLRDDVSKRSKVTANVSEQISSGIVFRSFFSLCFVINLDFSMYLSTFRTIVLYSYLKFV